jgi:hypothetical protein
VGIAIGLLLSSALLSKFSINATALVEATLVFWLIHLGTQLLALRVLVRQASIAVAGLLALGATVISLIVVNAVVSGLYIHGIQTYALATLIVWATTATSDMFGRRLVRDRRRR